MSCPNLCTCRTIAIRSCGDCAAWICSEHSYWPTNKDRYWLCARCVFRRADEKEREEQRAETEARAKYMARPLARVGDLVDAYERGSAQELAKSRNVENLTWADVAEFVHKVVGDFERVQLVFGVSGDRAFTFLESEGSIEFVIDFFGRPDYYDGPWVTNEHMISYLFSAARRLGTREQWAAHRRKQKEVQAALRARIAFLHGLRVFLYCSAAGIAVIVLSTGWAWEHPVWSVVLILLPLVIAPFCVESKPPSPINTYLGGQRPVNYSD